MYAQLVKVTDNLICIKNSYRITMPYIMDMKLDDLRIDYANNNVLLHLKNQTMINKWIAHNNLYKLNLFKKRTANIYWSYPVKWYELILYWILSRFIL